MAPDPRATALSREQLVAVVELLLSRQEHAHVAQAAAAAIDAVLSAPIGNTDNVGNANNENETSPSEPAILDEVSAPPGPSSNRWTEPPRPQTGRDNSASNRGDGTLLPQAAARRQNLPLRVAAQLSAPTQVASSVPSVNNGRSDSLPRQGPVRTHSDIGGSPLAPPRGPITTTSANKRQAQATPGSKSVPAANTGAVVGAKSPATPRGSITVTTATTPRGRAVAAPDSVTPRGSSSVPAPATPRGAVGASPHATISGAVSASSRATTMSAIVASTPATPRGTSVAPSSCTPRSPTPGSSSVAWSPTATSLGGFTSAQTPATPTGSSSVTPVGDFRPSPGNPGTLTTTRRKQRGPNIGVVYFLSTDRSGRRIPIAIPTKVPPVPDASRQCQKCKLFNPDPESICWFHPSITAQTCRRRPRACPAMVLHLLPQLNCRERLRLQSW
ncbi:hypothetical protein V8F20_007865 [Naviculisporaceae sp. PSN 640]